MKRISVRSITLGLAELIVFSALGAAAGLAGWYLLARTVELWRYDPAWVSTGFLVVLLVAGYAVPEVIERLWGWFRPSDSQGPQGGWGKSLRAFVSAIVVPVAVFAAANRFPQLSTPFFPPPSNEYQLVTQVADTVMASSSSTTRVTGIETLAAVSSKDSLAMLTKIVDQQPSVLNDQKAYDALSKAIASYGPQAKSWLLNTFQAHSQPPAAGAGRELEGGLYEQYFQPSFSDLQAEIKRSVTDPTRQNDLLMQLAAEESRLKADLADFGVPPPSLATGDRTLDFVLDTLAGLKASDDADISKLAKQVAGDAAYGVGTRRRAIFLVAQFGAPEDYDFLLARLQDSDESLRAAALAALKNLYQKSNSATAGSTSK